MFYDCDGMIARYGSAYQIGKAVDSGVLFKITRGLYSDEQNPDPNAVVCALYPRAVLTMVSAFYLHGLTDVVPELVHVATARNSTRVRDTRVRQYFMEPALMATGVKIVGGEGAAVRVFTRERMLVELQGADLGREVVFPHAYRRGLYALRASVDSSEAE